jgi:type VI secretion system secreted protein Hcp
VRKAGEGQKRYIQITMKEVLVTSISTGGSGGEDRLTENVTLNFAEVKFSYAPQKRRHPWKPTRTSPGISPATHAAA